WLTVMAMLDPQPALKAVSPQASPVDMFLGDDFHHNGAFRLSYGLEYATRMETDKEQHGKIPTWEDFVHHPNFDQFWQRQTAVLYLNRVTVPTLNVAGWWDQED